LEGTLNVHIDWPLAPLSLGSCFLGGFLISFATRWRIWVTAIVLSIAAVAVGAIVHPIIFELGDAVVAFLPALAGAAVGSIIRKKRIA
jgi:hypothetical protein